MPNNVSFRAYSLHDKAACLTIFDTNCPDYFATNERQDYAEYLDSNPEGYEVCLLNGDIVGAFGLSGDTSDCQRLDWILISSNTQGMGIGHQFMLRAVHKAKRLECQQINIAASHLSAPFFARYGANEVSHILDGWGLGMHRVNMELLVDN
ncbi:GNAT family N-acetyltransferase [Vibrio pectenicida]|uniref:GNAT family N-acetyltransferase n=1 Tax=Vibrio pectenicida TaxID=62763 RepID=A0A7Y3ZYI2_9VIBR|nr:GNAT family N-acetyltransferase [Vibrio pectenicida]NOH71263.1 GNAT family N-acetyltransferase [Vibrio pectenicida]